MNNFARVVAIAVMLCISCCSAIADVLQIKASAPHHYVVEKGDTLWDISGKFLEHPWLWPQLWRQNQYIENPHLIFPGDKLTLMYDSDGRPYLAVNKRRIKLSPKTRRLPKQQQPISTLPLSTVLPYLNAFHVFTNDGFIHTEDEPVVLGAESPFGYLDQHLKLYASGELMQGEPQVILHQGEPIISPDSGELLGYVAELVGTARVERVSTDDIPITTLHAENLKQEIRPGDHVIPLVNAESFPGAYHMQSATSSQTGLIVSTLTKGRELGKYEIALVDVGFSQGFAEGEIIQVVRNSTPIAMSAGQPWYRDAPSERSKAIARWLSFQSSVSLPSQREVIGYMMLVSVHENLSFALALETRRPFRIGDFITSPTQ